MSKLKDIHETKSKSKKQKKKKTIIIIQAYIYAREQGLILIFQSTWTGTSEIFTWQKGAIYLYIV